jgi:diguanylate cyclase (GGDEF)-like protein
MTSEWIVVLEAAAGAFAAGLDEATLARLIEVVSDTRPIALHSADRYALQLRVVAESPSDALGLALGRWSDAVLSLGAPGWEVVRADVMSPAELGLELELERRREEDAHRRDATAAGQPNVRHGIGGDVASDLRWRLMLQDAPGRLIVLSAEGAVVLSVPPLGGLLLSEDGSTPPLAAIVHPDDADIVSETVSRLCTGGRKTDSFVMRLRGDDGWRWYEATARNLLDEPLVGAIVVNIGDVTERKGLEERLARLARQDDLTGLVNRAVFLDCVELALARAAEPSKTAVLFVDIDNFRGLVERVGIQAGDRLLMTVADRMRTGLCEGATAARLGRDEFALLCDNVASAADGARIAKRTVDLLSEPAIIDGEEIQVGVSIGVALGRSGPLQAATLLRHGRAGDVPGAAGPGALRGLPAALAVPHRELDDCSYRSRNPTARPMTAARADGSEMPSNPNPKYSASGVVTTAPSGNPAAVVLVKSLPFGALPGGAPATVQPPRPSSNDVASPVETEVSSTNTPRPWMLQSLT